MTLKLTSKRDKRVCNSLKCFVKGVVPRNYCAVFLSEIDWFLAKIVFDKV